MALWRMVGSPLEFDAGGSNDVAMGWAWTLERDGFESRTVEVVVADTVLWIGEPSESSRQAIVTSGASAIETFLDHEDPPPLLMVSSTGVAPADEHA
jgi:hypothetical protein